MDFVPFQPVAQIINFSDDVKVQEKKQELKEAKVLKGLRKDLSAKYAFIEKYKLVELKSDQEDKLISYYYDTKSKTIFEIKKDGPIVFMKTNPEQTKHLIKLNDL
jgi:hypothetical protein